MPIYEYRCAQCGSAFEVLVRNRKDQPAACPSCGGRKLDKLFSAFAAHQAPAAGLPACASGACGIGNCGSGACPLGDK